eukprot:scaffold662509_cov50-Prasinocladus_malaysianus.AAC.1
MHLHSHRRRSSAAKYRLDSEEREKAGIIMADRDASESRAHAGHTLWGGQVGCRGPGHPRKVVIDPLLLRVDVAWQGPQGIRQAGRYAALDAVVVKGLPAGLGFLAHLVHCTSNAGA